MVDKISLLIRTRNDRENLEKILAVLKEQDFKGGIELILVDTESIDGTVNLAKQRGAKIVTIKQTDFNYPKSLNLGMEVVSNEIVVEIVGHALPFRKDWLSSGLSHLDDPKVAGVYSPVIPNKGASLAEKKFYLPGFLKARYSGPFVVRKSGMGVFGATNIVIRRSLWVKHHFDERFGLGGEDGEWASWALNQGYKIICDYRFSVKHSHGLDQKELRRQIAYWSSLGQPSEFELNQLSFRSDLKE